MLATRACFVLISALVFAGPARAQIWYVDANATPPGNGSPESPYSSVQYAIVQPTTLNGHVLLLAPGVYREAITITGKSLTLRGAKGAGVTEVLGGAHLDAAIGLFDGLTLGGVYVEFSFGVTIERCVLRGSNRGLYVGLANVYLRRSTVVGNTVGVEVKAGDGYLEMENSIVWNNQANHWGNYVICADYCAGDLPSSSCGVGQLPGDPGTWDPIGADAHLLPGSPCIDAADPTLPPDPDGSPADIGAIPYDPRYVPTPTVYCNIKQNSQGCLPSIQADGPPSVSSSHPFRIGAHDLIGRQVAVLWYSVAGPANTLQQGIKHCTAAPRSVATLGPAQGATSSACSGFVSYDFNALVQSGLDPDLVAGTMVYAQWWYRDPLLVPGGGWTNAVRFGIGL